MYKGQYVPVPAKGAVFGGTGAVCQTHTRGIPLDSPIPLPLAGPCFARASVTVPPAGPHFARDSVSVLPVEPRFARACSLAALDLIWPPT